MLPWGWVDGNSSKNCDNSTVSGYRAFGWSAASSEDASKRTRCSSRNNLGGHQCVDTGSEMKLEWPITIISTTSSIHLENVDNGGICAGVLLEQQLTRMASHLC